MLLQLVVVRRVTRLSWNYGTEHSAVGNVDMLNYAWAYYVSGSESDALMKLVIIPHSFSRCVRNFFTGQHV